MIEARHTTTGKWLAGYCSGSFMDRYFRRVETIGTDETGQYPLLMFANHFSWWDGFIQYRLNREVFGRKLHVMMLEEQLKNHMIMNRCGCFSIRKNSRSIIETMNYARELMADPQNMVLIFPQGEIGSIHTDRIRFRSGAGYLMKLLGTQYRIVFNVNLIDYGPFKKPALSIYHTTVNPGSVATPGELEDSYDAFYGACLKYQSSKVW